AGPEGRRPSRRVASAARAGFYAVAAFSALSFAAGRGGGRSGDEQSRDVTAAVLAVPAGQWLVGVAGLAVAIGGVVIAVNAARLSFREEMDT
ncbi:membrane protein, partial [Streptomyces sp. RSD-27]